MLEKLSGVALGKLVNDKYISPVEVIDYFARRIEERNPSLNAFTYTRIDEAMERAKELESEILKGGLTKPLAGVPVALKDFLPSKKGWPNSHGGVPCLVAEDPCDSEFCRAAESLGAIVVGKTNAPAFGFSGCTTNTMYGPTHNPFDLSRNSGGSSGGSAAAVADGLVLLAEGGDAGGSIRIPAAWCNCFGFKAGLGMIPSVCRPDAWAATHPYCFAGALTKTVEDSLVMYNMMNCYDPRDPYSLPFHKSMLSRPSNPGRALHKYRIAATYDFNLFPELDSEMVNACDKFIELVEHKYLFEQSSNVDMWENFNFKFTLEEFTDMWCTAISVDTTLDIEAWKSTGLDLFGDHADEVPEKFIEYQKKAAAMNIHDFRRFNEMRTDILDNFEDAFEHYDFILSPVTACSPIKNNDLDKVNTINFGLTFLVNFVGYPAMSIPVGFDKDGLPIGVQIVGKKYCEAELFDFAFAIEEAMPWMPNYSKSLDREI